MDARVDDVAAGKMDAARDAVEKPGMVRRAYRHQRGAARGIEFGRHGQRFAVMRIDQLQVLRDDVLGLGDPVCIVELARQLDETALVDAERGARCILLGDDAFAPAMLLVAQPQHLLGRFEQCAQQLALPAVPDARTHRADIDHGQHQQQFQALGALHHGGKIGDGLVIGEVALERGGRHQQVIAHQPGDLLGLRLGHAEPRAQLHRDLGTQHAVVAAPPLGDIVQQRGDEQHAAADQFLHHVIGERMVLLELARLDLRQQPDRADRMLVHRIMVIHVELHLRHDAAEIGHETAEHGCLVHPAQHQLGIARAAQHVHEQRIGTRIGADMPVDQMRIHARLTHRAGVDLDLVPVGKLEDLDQPHRVLAEEIGPGQSQPPAIENEARKLAWTPPQYRGDEASVARGELVVELRQEHAGQVADAFGVEEEILHEPLDRRLARAVGKAHPRRHLALQVEGEPVFGAPGNVVQMAAHRPEEIGRATKPAIFGHGQQAGIDQLGGRAHLVDILADPVERVQVAQAPLAVLDIGFDDIAAVAHALVPLVALLELLRHEVARGAGNDILPEAHRGLAIDVLIAPDIAPFEQCGADGQVAARLADHLVDRAAGMPDLEAEVPHHVEHRLDRLLGPAVLAQRGEEGDVDIAVRGHLAPAIAAHRRDAEMLARAVIGDRVLEAHDIVVDQPHDLVDQERLRRRAIVPRRRIGMQPRGDLRAPRRQRLTQDRDDGHARLVAEFGGELGNARIERAAIDDRALVCNGVHGKQRYRRKVKVRWRLPLRPWRRPDRICAS